MKHVRCIMVLIIGAALLLPGATALLNPAAVYCDAMNYTYTVESDETGERGYCVVDAGTHIDAWAFLRGEEGTEYGYCERQGYDTRTITDPALCADVYSDSCAVCVLPDGNIMEVTALMGLSYKEPDLVIDGAAGPVQTAAPAAAPTATETPLSLLVPLAGVAATMMVVTGRIRKQ
ncbi:DUF333 domain-containing protein [Methanovulcanius yangii]|uniref:DUF333 domain-containing protein n=1 Tax=Methanovulcanius yangii TaxID=1789227 RepID=UPI0029C9D1C8|nr:DUF333 domain-containing protein [Methanovulcanius yangii]